MKAAECKEMVRFVLEDHRFAAVPPGARWLWLRLAAAMRHHGVTTLRFDGVVPDLDGLGRIAGMPPEKAASGVDALVAVQLLIREPDGALSWPRLFDRSGLKIAFGWLGHPLRIRKRRKRTTRKRRTASRPKAPAILSPPPPHGEDALCPPRTT